MNCLICKSKLIWGADFDAEDYGYDCEGVVGTYHCSNEDCGLFYEMINLFHPSDDKDSEDYYMYGEEFIKFYKIDEDEY